MKTILIKGNLIANKLTIVNGEGGVKSLYTKLEEVPCDTIVICGDVEVKGELVVNYALLVTGEVVETGGMI